MSTSQLVDRDEFPARTALKGAQERLAAALATATAAGHSLARGRERQGELEQQLDAASAEVAHEATMRAEAFEQGPCAVILGQATKKRRDLEDQLSGFEATLDILTRKSSDAQRAIGECEASLAAAVKGVIAEEVSPLLCRMQDCENAAAELRSQLRALQYSGRWGLCPESLPARLADEPANVFHAGRPLPWGQQQVFDRRKSAWCDLADRLREDASAMLSLGD
jgi:hypothetical protein